MLASQQGSGTTPGCDGDEDVAMGGIWISYTMERSERGSASPRLLTSSTKLVRPRSARQQRHRLQNGGFDLEAPRKCPEGHPKLDTLHADMKHVGAHRDQAHDRAKWRQKVRKADPPPNEWDNR
ncbi:hypothetical protein ANCDUO_24580 [Ancylostoma duodenale]|uniref:Uncharacterized protein n=1 Tax=Ancylostoma duodenale TaxID=51022 RepID=A0A0C2FFG8_9BILA|nr:hypothetical protein ANCDUO_24580 [Ancylostoma duodenale]